MNLTLHLIGMGMCYAAGHAGARLLTDRPAGELALRLLVGQFLGGLCCGAACLLWLFHRYGAPGD